MRRVLGMNSKLSIAQEYGARKTHLPAGCGMKAGLRRPGFTFPPLMLYNKVIIYGSEAMATKSSAKNKPRSNRSAASKAAQTRAANQEQLRRQREARGVLFIAAGVLLGVYLFVSGTGVLGAFLSELLFGLCGWFAYVLPVVLLATGILTIAGSHGTSSGSTGWTTTGVVAVMTLAQTALGAAYRGVPYIAYLSTAYQTGAAYPHRGGGAIGALLCYPLQQLGGAALAYVLSIAMLLIVILMVTRLSLRDMSARVNRTVHTAVERVRSNEQQRRMPVYDLQKPAERDVPAEPAAPAKKPRTRRKADGDLSDFNAFTADLPVSAEQRKVKNQTPAAAREELSYIGQAELHARPVRTIAPPEIASQPKPVPPLPKGDAIWEELEPAEDFPFTVEPLAPAAPPAPSPSAEEDVFAPLNPASAESAPPVPAAGPKKAVVIEHTPARAEDGGDTDAVPDIVIEQPPVYIPPSYSLLNPPSISYGRSSEDPNATGKLLIDTLASFNIGAKLVNVTVGPVITRFELQPAPGVRVNRITALSNDIALALAAPRVRIEAPIPGKAAVGVEIPNKNAVTVVLRDIIESREFQNASSPITMALGKDTGGKVITADLAKMPHMLIAGSTGSGKSVCINDLIISMVYKSSPADLRMILIDPKVVELSVFGTLPHLLIPVVTEPKKASGALRWAVNEMTMRYKKFSEFGARDLARYNELQDSPEKRLPKLVVIIDELADLMMVAPDEVEDSICRIAQLGRASGIHLIVATQRPSADIITGLIKANIPSRCAFAVSSGIDSRIILDTTGAEKLLGRGDMLFHPNGANKPVRLQCAFVSDEEVERVVNHFRDQQQAPRFDEQVISDLSNAAKGGATGGVFGEGKQEDELLGEALRVVLESGQASISMIQRRLRVGYARAARLIDMMEQSGYVSGFDGSKPRRVLIKRSEFEALFGDGTYVEGAEEAQEPEEQP